jgi:hypothetical protein
LEWAFNGFAAKCDEFEDRVTARLGHEVVCGGILGGRELLSGLGGDGHVLLKDWSSFLR